ncbi:MAG: SurA N-terminal domain-containing protein [Desulfobacteria bacterium]
MLSLMRKHAQSWLIKLALGAIVVVFVFWGVGSYRAQKGNRIALVNGDPIVLEAFRSVYDQMLQTYRRQFGDVLDEKLIQNLNLRKQALDQLIDRQLLLQEAARLNFGVTDEELLRAIQGVPAFQRHGHFHPRQYELVLNSNRMTPEMYEESKRYELLVERLQSFIFGSIKVSEAEALETYNWLKNEVSVEYVVFKPSTYTNVELTPEEIEAYFSKNEKAYEIPPRVKVQHLLLDFKGFEAEADISDEDVGIYFDLNKEDYATPKKVRARHILFQVGPDPKPETIEEARKKALNVLENARSGADFGELAKKHSDDPGSRDKGGDLGFFARDRMVKPFSDAAFSTKAGEISELIRTDFGWHIIKVEGIEEAKEPVMAEVADQIRKKLAKDEARTLAFDRAEEIYEACYGAGNISEVAERNQLKVHETDLFSENDPIKGVKEGQEFAQTAFALGEDEVGEPLELSDGYYILQLIAKQPATIPELKSVEEKVTQDLTEQRRNDLAKKDAEEFLNDLKGGAEFQKAAASRELKAETTGFFERSGTIPGLEAERNIQETAFKLSQSKPLPDAVIRGTQGYYVVQFKARQEADPKEFEEKKSEITTGLLFQKRQRATGEFVDGLRKKSEISIQDGFLD